MSHSMTEQDLEILRQRQSEGARAPAAPPVERTQPREQAAEQTQPRETAPAEAPAPQAQAGTDEHDTMDTGQVPGTAAMSTQFAERPSDAEIAEIEAERERRLHNRPPNAEVDNTHRTFDPETGRFEDCQDPIHSGKQH